MGNINNYLHFYLPKPPQPNLPLFIYLPGLDCTGKLFYTQKGITDNFDVRCLVIPPHDCSDWNTLSLELIDLIKKEVAKNGQRYIYLCGESFGGCLAIYTALSAPDLFHRLILINPATSFNQKPWLSLGIPITEYLPDFFSRQSCLILLPFLAALGRMKASESRSLLNAMKYVPSETVSWRLSLLKNFVIKENILQKIHQPVLIIAAGKDKLLDSLGEAKRLVQMLSHGKIFVLPHSGHACLLETEINLDKILKESNFVSHPSLSLNLSEKK